jgi:hypothetical protein
MYKKAGADACGGVSTLLLSSRCDCVVLSIAAEAAQ